MPASYRNTLIEELGKLPVIAHTTFLLFGTMLFFSITNEYIEITDIHMNTSSSFSLSADLPSSSESPHGETEYENLLLKCIEDGNHNYKKILPDIFSDYSESFAPGHPLRQVQDEAIAASTLYSRAAIRGGLSRDTSLALSGLYIESVESAESVSEIISLHHIMLDDFITRVHDIKQLESYSVVTKACVDYIRQHITENLTVLDVAQAVGYAGYYVSTLFKNDLHMSIANFIKQEKVAYAKPLLENTLMPIGDIADKLSFSSPSYFCFVFNTYTGQTPAMYRKTHTKE